MSDRGEQFYIPQLCNAPAISLLVLVNQLLALVLLFAGGEFDWTRLALTSLFVQWVGLLSAGLICAARGWLSRLDVMVGSLVTYGSILAVTLSIAVVAQWILNPGAELNWGRIGGQLVIAAIIAGLALRYFYVQQQLRVREQAELQSRIQALQSRIRPHFLFNSMNIIASLIAVEPETAESVVEDLSELFRASLNDAGNQVSLAEEIDLCERYVRIESLRLGDRLQVRWDFGAQDGGVTPDDPDPQGSDVTPSALHKQARIPLLTLQPLLENAIYHGIQPIPEGGTIDVRLWFESDRVHISIENPMPQNTNPSSGTSSHGNRMALNNIRSRLQVLYGSRAEIKTEVTSDAQGERFITRLHFPMQPTLPQLGAA